MEGLKLTWWQRQRLAKQLKEAQDARLYRRTLAVLEVDRGRSIAEVAQALDVTRQSIYNWIASYAQAYDPRALQDEPHRKILIGSNMWQSTGTFDKLRIPPGDRDIILSFHFYTPMLITHYKASWTEVGRYKGPVNYPGQIVSPEEVAKLDPEIARIVKGNNGVYNRERLESLLAKPLELAKKLDLPLYCGEWGALPTTPREVRMQWYRDMRANLDKHGIAWANWDYKGGFGIVGRGGQPDQEFIKVLLGR